MYQMHTRRVAETDKSRDRLGGARVQSHVAEISPCLAIVDPLLTSTPESNPLGYILVNLLEYILLEDLAFVLPRSYDELGRPAKAEP